MSEVIINGRFRRQQVTGIQRVAESVSLRLQTPHEVFEPRGSGTGARGHTWEQAVLPFRAGSRLIWGPANTGPLISKRQILTMHGAGIFDHPEWFSPAFVNFHRPLWRKLAQRVLKIVTVSEFSRDRLSEVLGIGKDRIEVIWNGVDEQFRPASDQAIAEAKAAFGLNGRPYFVTLSTIEPRKNLPLVLGAWEAARAQLPRDMALLIIGPKGAANVFGAHSPDANFTGEGVIRTGYVPDAQLPPLLSGAVGLLYPSLYEGFGLPLVEGMACGVPVVTTRLTSLPEVGGEAVLYVDPHDPAELAERMVDLAGSQDLRAERRQAGLDRVFMFSWTTAAQRMDELFRRHG
ncbi:glycosyltransferase family 1 protein [soil metagenome]